MTSCGAHTSPTDRQLSLPTPATFQHPLSPIETPFLPWRSSPPSCDFAEPPIFGSSYPPDPDSPQELRAKSTPPLDCHRHALALPYPSPPLTDAALASNIPLPEVAGVPLFHDARSLCCEEHSDWNMPRNGARHVAPLSPPPTGLVGFKDLPSESEFDSGVHQVEAWRYGEGLEDGSADVAVPMFPPVRDDSGFEEFGPCEGNRALHSCHGESSKIEPTAVWSPQSPLSMNEGFPLMDFPSLQLTSSTSGDRRSIHQSDILVSPISMSDDDNHSDTWSSESEMDWTSSPSSTFVDDFAPASPKPGGLSLDFAELPPTSLGLLPPSPSELLCGDFLVQPTPQPDDHHPFFSFHHAPLHSPSADLDTEYPDTVMPPEDEDDSTALPPPSPRRRPLNDLDDPTLPHSDVFLTPIPHSPHRGSLILPDFEMEDSTEAPSSPHSPNRALPQSGDEELPPLFEGPSVSQVDTISPSLLCGAPEPQAGLCLLLQPVSDPPLARSPSPDEDDFGFLDVQLDSESANVEVDEFLQLRALRKTALLRERAARLAEAEINERITALATTLLPPSHTDSQSGTDSDPGEDAVMSSEIDVCEKRARKRELHSLMDQRAEARRHRKLQKQRSKEIGALLEFKMHPGMSPMEDLPLVSGKGWTRSIAHLVAHMLLKRHDRSRPLETKQEMLSRRPSYLHRSVSAEDLFLSVDGDLDEDDDMEM